MRAAYISWHVARIHTAADIVNLKSLPAINPPRCPALSRALHGPQLDTRDSKKDSKRTLLSFGTINEQTRSQLWSWTSSPIHLFLPILTHLLLQRFSIGAVITQQLQGIHYAVAFCCCGSKTTPSQNVSVRAFAIFRPHLHRRALKIY